MFDFNKDFVNHIAKYNVFSFIEKIKDKSFWIYGPPGTGKTTYLLNIVEKKIKEGYEPHEIAFVSFTRAARAEARFRAISVKSIQKEELRYFRTIHSIAYHRLGLNKENVLQNKHLKEFGDKFGYRFSLLDYPQDLESDQLIPEYGFAVDDNLLQAYHLFLNKLETDKEKAYSYYKFLFDSLPKRLKDFLIGSKRRRFERFLQDFKSFCYDKDLIDFSSMLLQDIIEFGNECINDVKIAFIDEVQDLTPLQMLTVLRWFSNCNELYFAGDDEQAIYTFQGADYKIMLKAHNIVPKENQKILEKSYRVPEKIRRKAMKILNEVRDRVKKDWRALKNKGEIFYIDRLDKFDFEQESSKKIFCLFRNRYFFNNVASYLFKKRIPYIVEGWSMCPQPFAGKKIQNVINSIIDLRNLKGISVASFSNILDFIKVKDGLIPRGLKAKIKRLLTMEHKVYLSNLETLNAKKLKEAIINNPSLIFESKHGSYRYFYRDIILKGKKIEKINIFLKTIHSSKGQEADTVFIDPSLGKLAFHAYKRKDSQEYRIAYVATTRTKNDLYILKISNNDVEILKRFNKEIFYEYF